MNDTAPLDLSAPNIPLLRKAVEWAEAEAAKTDGTCLWNQGSWAEKLDCGTAYCIAGFAVVAGEPAATAHPYDGDGGLLELRVGGELTYWGEAARQLLGLTWDEADNLFEENNTIADVRRYAEQIAARAGERL